ncbi:MAG: selenide, water dikinase SelD [Bacteroidetes bacterium]|nr:MAG: selenide, water dikinase SelD [Bacteroidota bacterium]
MTEYKLTEYSHGSGCGCKISPKVLDKILDGIQQGSEFPNLIVGNDNKDDAAVIAIDDDRAIISTTDFFMPIVDDPYDFGRIAATNAISDIYAMGGKPIMAISIFGWPIDKLPDEVGKRVIEGGRKVCDEAGIPLAGGHSIDSPEPIFGLAVTGIIDRSKIKSNDGARVGDKLYLTKPLGIGILTTAEKRKILRSEEIGVATELMLKPNKIGERLAELSGVSAITDVTGFGLLGHLTEICEASKVSAHIEFAKVPVIDNLAWYLQQGCSPGGTQKNFDSYGHKISQLTKMQKSILCDPQTSGGLLISLNPAAEEEFQGICHDYGLEIEFFGEIKGVGETQIRVL